MEKRTVNSEKYIDLGIAKKDQMKNIQKLC